MATEPPTSLSATLAHPGCRSLAIAGLFLSLSVVWVTLVQVAVGVLLVGLQLARGGGLADLDPELIEQAFSAELIAIASMVQLLGLGAIAVALARLQNPDMRIALALRRAPTAAWVVAGLGGLTVGFFPGWVAQQLLEVVPWLDMGNLDLLEQALTESSPVGRLLMLTAICLFAPVLEELVFRGFLWNTLDRALPTWGVWLLTSMLFAAYHVDPIHVISVFFTGLFLGWLRWIGGSVGPSVAGHFVNNTLAAVVTFTARTDDDVSVPLSIALLAAAITVALGVGGWFGRERAT
ncbi:MAG: CPBP family intramembrane metalloprotease [Deltaproteobacteria bacterium]|nr:CPBP family intramembrane metalloprotease [Deltaproteobacteria bacterium]